MNKRTGWERENRTHFDSIAAEYEAVRPEWIGEIFRDIQEYTKPTQGKNAAEIGVGTGKATAPILSMGYNVTAVEINPSMAAYSLNRFKSFPNFSVVVSSFEDVPLKENSFDLIYAASSIHWVDAEIGLPKARRLLKDNGVIALFRYNEVASIDDELYKEVHKIHSRYYGSYYNVPYSEPVRKTHEDFYKPEEIYKGFRFKDLQSYGFRDVTMQFYDVTLGYSADEYIALLSTLADFRNLPENVRAPLYKELKGMIDGSGGKYKTDYVFQLYLGRK